MSIGIFGLIGIAFGMSMDAFAVSLGKGASLHRPSLANALKMGATFGIMEGLTPLLGYGLGVLAADFVKFWDHWLSLVLLSGLGIQMIVGAVCQERDDDTPKQKSPLLFLTAFATSIDAMIVGVSLAFLQVNIATACVLIGLATAFMVTLGILFGAKVGEKMGKSAEIFGGLMLIGIGIFILISHLTAG